MTSTTFHPTPEQKAIIDHDGSAFVEACPGAGKTRVITERARQLFANLPVGRGVAFLSFTNSAIFELENRLRKEGILPSPSFPSFVGTFDSFIWNFMIAPFGLSSGILRPRLIPDLDDLEVVPYPKALKLTLSCFCPRTGNIHPQKAKKEGFDTANKEPWRIAQYERVASKMRVDQREKGHISYEEVRTLTRNRLDEPEFSHRIGLALAARFHEFIVDEAQDCNPDDLRVISWLRYTGLPVKVLCDPHQSIYGFRGGVSHHLADFSQEFSTSERKNLTGNFRSAPNVCKSTAQFRPMASSADPDEALGQYRDNTASVVLLSNSARAVGKTIGDAFCEILEGHRIVPSDCPIIAATKFSASAAAGQPCPKHSTHRTIRLAKAVSDFQFASGFNDVKNAIEQLHIIALELEGQLGGLSYSQYIAKNEIEPSSWRPRILFLLSELHFDPSKNVDARGWHNRAKELLVKHLTIGSGQSIAQQLRWNDDVQSILVPVSAAAVKARTIHSVKGMEFPAVCLVTTTTLKSILDYLETGVPESMAEEARKLYVAASRAERLLVIAAPKSQANRLATFLGRQGASVDIHDL